MADSITMGGDLARIATVFEGSALTSYVFRGRLCWIAADVGAVLGYDPGGFRTCLGDWSDELLEGQDVATLRGGELRDFKEVLDASVKSTLARASQLAILYEPGLHVVCLKTEKPLGKKLRRHLADEVLPKLVRGEPIAPAAQVSEWTHEAIALKKAALLCQIANDMSPAVSIEARDALRANAAAIISGVSVNDTLPRLTSGEWYRPTDMAKVIGVTANAIGRAITKLGLRGGEHCKTVMDTKAHSSGQVEAYLYDAEASRLIREYVEAQRAA